MKRKLISVLLCIAMLASLLSLGFTPYAATVNKGKIEIPTISAVIGDTVVIPVKITENPGVMAMSISITYNSKALELVKMTRGDVLKDKTSVAQKYPDKNLVRFVHCEQWDATATGTLFSLHFKVKENAEFDTHKVSIDYSEGDFCNWNMDRLMPEIIAGGVSVAYNGKNCSHKSYGEWSIAAPPNCEEEGTSQRYCEKCGHVDSKAIKALGHEYSKDWTIDKQATEETPGTMSRYCIRCSDYVDRITFELKDTEKEKIDNLIGTEVPKNNFTENLFEKQNPDKELSPTVPDEKIESTESNNILTEPEDSSPEKDNDPFEKAINKIKKAFPNYEKLLEIFKYLLILIFILII